MDFTFLIYKSPTDFALRSNLGKQQAFFAGWLHYIKALTGSKVVFFGTGHQQPKTATTLKIRDGQRLMQDGHRRWVDN